MGTLKKRREFLQQLGMAATIPMLGAFPLSAMYQDKMTNTSKEGKLGIALVGLGSYAEGQLAPALLQTEHCYLAGIVTGTPAKVKPWQERYGIADKNVYSYENFDSIANNKDIDIVYVVLPNAMHAEFVIRAAQAGKHVICEKPMATTVEDCDRMIQACAKAKVQLSIGYRLHFDPYHLELTKLVKDNAIGKLK
ncbi:MAG: gfo/Idh/MocA family oxidoreductase, partial [Cytophagia bacterium]|nr:gfo/Idh/MocA family oxidoreductase [Cytophagia bacterium]